METRDEDIGGIWAQSGAQTGEGEPEQANLGMLTANFLRILAPLLSTLLFEVRPTDATTYVAGALLLSSAALIASLLPARHTTRVDPMVVLGHE